MRLISFSSINLIGCFLSKVLFLLLLSAHHANSGSIVETLPGFSGPLPFKLETGYIGVEDAELFYYFIESSGNPRSDPLLLYLIGGPGCSGSNGLFFQAGPLAFNTTDYTGDVPQIVLTPNSWTKTASIIFIDSPVGTGFSYATTTQGYDTSDTKAVRQLYKFMRKFLIEHPEFITNRVFISTDSFAGKHAPILSQHILDTASWNNDTACVVVVEERLHVNNTCNLIWWFRYTCLYAGNAAGIKPFINLIGFLSGSPAAEYPHQVNSRVPFAHRLALISDKLYKAAKESCSGWYYEPDPSNAKCLEALKLISQCVENINEFDVIEPNCASISPKPNGEGLRRDMKEAEGFHPPSRPWWCKDFYYILIYIWSNLESVQEALHVRQGTVPEWFRCNLTVRSTYDYDIESAVPYQKNLTDTGLQTLIYTGDHDYVVPHLSTEGWIKLLGITVDDSWQPWFVDGEVAGYKVKYTNGGYRMTYATLKGSGHSPTQYYREKCFQMFERWIHFYPL